jgi:F-type H+-transporting ATPase subunit delta
MKTPLRQYAQAYLAAAGKPQAAVAAFDACASVIEQVPMLRAFLANAAVSAEKRRDALALAAPKQPDTAYHFFLLLAKDRRLRDLRALGTALRNEAAAMDGKRHAVVTSAIPLTAPTLDRIAAALKNRFTQDIWLESRIDPSVIAGLAVQVGDWTFDATRNGRLTRLAKTLHV